MKQWRVAQIGCGAMAAVHADQIAQLPEARMVLAVDLNDARGRQFGARYGFARTSTRWEDAAEAEDVDIVVVATYADTHHPICTRLLESGKHVICEKPYSHKLHEVTEIAETVRRTGNKLRIGFMQRFNHGMRKIKEMVDAGAIGPKPWYYRFTMTQTPRIEDTDGGWRYLANLIDNAGSSTSDCGIHFVDLLRWWTGEEVTHVSSIGVITEDKPRPRGPNLSLMAMHLSGGSVGWIEDNWARVTKVGQDMELIGPEGRISFQFANFRVKAMEREGDCIEYFSKRTYRTELVALPTTGAKQTGAQFKQFVREIETDADMSGHLDDVYKCTEAVLAADLAAEEKRTVALPLGRGKGGQGVRGSGGPGR